MPAALGFGQCPFGTAPYGLGTPATTPPLGGNPLTDAQGTRQGARKIDLKTRRYIYDATGRAVGDDPIHQMMQMVATTDTGSCAVLAVGNKIKSIQDITSNFVSRCQNVYTTAYARMVARGLIKLGTITVDVTRAQDTASGVSQALIRIPYTNLTTGQDGEITL